MVRSLYHSGLSFLIILILGVLTISCEVFNKKNAATGSSQLESLSLDHLDTPKWEYLIKNNIEALKSVYLPTAIKIFKDGTVLQGNDSIINNYKTLLWDLDSIQLIKQIVASPDKTYEIGKIYLADHNMFSFLRIRHKEKIELEFIDENRASNLLLTEIDKSRDQWIKHCANHSAKDLVNNVYTQNALYYNHKPLVKGREAIIKEYGYMNNSNYKLILTPIHIELVNEHTAYEIGQCIGSYGGNYVIIWSKNDQGEWQVLLDSNI